MFQFSGKNVVYVGGFSGIGYEACRVLVKRNIKHLVICSRMENVEMLKKLQVECPTVQLHFVQINLMDRVLIEQAVKSVIANVDNIDVLVNGAGVVADKDVETTIGVNLTGLIHMTLQCLPYMDKSQMGKGGIVVNVASVFGLEPSSAVAVYAAAKHGVVGFTRSMADKHFYQQTGICFICICPGLTATEQMLQLRANAVVPHSELMVAAIEKAKQQKPQECAMNMIKAIELMKNGSIYLCNAGELKEAMPTAYWQL